MRERCEQGTRMDRWESRHVIICASKQLVEGPCVGSSCSQGKCWYAVISAQIFCCVFLKSMCIFIISYSFHVCVYHSIWEWVCIRLYHLTASFAELIRCPYLCVCQGEMLASSPVGFGIQECETGPTCLGRNTGMVQPGDRNWQATLALKEQLLHILNASCWLS